VAELTSHLPCAPWTTVSAVRDCCVIPPDPTVPDAVVENSILMASFILYYLTGRQFPGICDAVIRPFGKECASWRGTTYWDTFVNTGGIWWGNCDHCCNKTCSIDLGTQWPVTSIVQVLLDGVIVDPSEYRIDEYRYLTRLSVLDPISGIWDDDLCWPSCQIMSRPSTAEGTFEVTFQYGIAPPPMGEYAARKLACELVKACVGEDCRLPNRTKSINRQGVSFDIASAMDLIDVNRGRTGLYEVDLFIQTVNPSGLQSRGFAWSPDMVKNGGRNVGT
jgi:hypothetical protein